MSSGATMIGVDFIGNDKNKVSNRYQRIALLVVDAVPTIGSYVKLKGRRYKVLEVEYEYTEEWLSTRTSATVRMENV